MVTFAVVKILGYCRIPWLAALVVYPIGAMAQSATSALPVPREVKSYLLTALGKMETAANEFVADAAAYDSLVKVRGGNVAEAFKTSPAEITRLVEALREEYKAMDSFGYETIEGIVAGVPSLSEFDVYLDSGVPQDQAGGGTPVAPVVLALPTGDKIDHAGCLFTYLIEHKIYARVDPTKGKFRSFLLASLKNLLADAYDRAQTLKRGGGREFLPLNEEQAEEAESLFQTHCAGGDSTDEDRLFERTWAETLVSGALGRLAEEYKAQGKEKPFAELRIFLSGGADPLPTYAELATRLNIPSSTLRSDVARLRARYRETLRAEVRRTVDRESEVEGELRELLRVLTNR